MTEPFRVLYVATTCNAGGAEQHLLELCRQLPRRLFLVQLAYFKDEPGARSLVQDFESAGVHIRHLGQRWPLDPVPIVRLTSLIRTFRPHIVHTHLYRADIAGMFVSQLLRVPIKICTVHNMELESTYRRIRPLVQAAYRGADRLVAISSAVRDVLCRTGIDSGRVEVIHYGLRMDSWPAAPYEESGFVIGTIGRLHYQKAYDVAIPAFARVLEQEPRARLLIAGHDEQGIRPSLHALAEKLGVTHAVSFLGHVGDVPDFLTGLRAFILASRSEGFGLVLLEAMAMQRPIVATRVGAIPEVIEDGISGLLVPAEDPEALAQAILWVLSHPMEAGLMGHRGRQRVLNSFASRTTADRTVALYRGLLAQKSISARNGMPFV